MGRKNSFHREGQHSGKMNNDGMNYWKEKSNSPADTYIEWCFEHKCKYLTNGFNIITEWRTRKQQYTKITGTTIYDFQHYSCHDESHSIAILMNIELLLGKRRVDMLSAGDLWLLLEAAYSHDIGMALKYEEVFKLWTEDDEFQKYIYTCIEDDFEDVSKAALYYKEIDNLLRDKKKMEDLENCEEITFGRDWPVLSQKYILILVTEYIRKKHAERVTRVFDNIDPVKQSVIPPRLYLVSSAVSAMHGRDFNKILGELKYSTTGFGNNEIHPQFVAAMLRIGDLLDLDNNRFNPYAIEHFGRIPLASLLHLKKHEAITHIEVSESEITFEAHTDEYEVGLLTNDWFQMIDAEVKNLICHWNTIVPKTLRGCTLRQSKCKVFLKDKTSSVYQEFDAHLQRDFSLDKKKLIKLLIGTSIYSDDTDFLREYIQNAMDASKMQLWIDIENGKYEYSINTKVMNVNELSPLDLDSSVYKNYIIQISVGWNSTKDKIQLKIIDQGIGIEETYLKQLSNIGTGWKGRTEYKDKLRDMPKWLQPTGGFGIGIQSAFMAADTIELYTKSEKDINGYKMILNSPNKGNGGSISVEKISHSIKRGTAVVIELDIEKFQVWIENMNQKCDEWTEFDRDNLDEFDQDATLIHAQKVLKQYMKWILPNPLIPIEITSSISKYYLYTSDFLHKVDYWKENPNNKVLEIQDDNKCYQCIYIPDRPNDKFLILERENYILYIIQFSKVNSKKSLCFKNIFVRDTTIKKMKQYDKFEVCVDFMGFKAEECLKIHRNSFNKSFQLENYWLNGFSVLIRFLKSLNEKNSDDIFRKYLGKYEIQLMCMSKFYALYNPEFEKSNGENRAIIYLDSQIDEQQNLQMKFQEMEVEEQRILQNLQEFYETLLSTQNVNAPNKTLLVALEKGKNYSQDYPHMAVTRIHPNKIKQWLSGKEFEEESERAFWTSIQRKVGAIADSYTIDILLHDERIKKHIFYVANKEEYCFLLLSKKETFINPTIDEICEVFWSDDNSNGRNYIVCTSLAEYEALLVERLVYQKAEQEMDNSFLLSPISRHAYRLVMQQKKSGKELSYEMFRTIVWGIRGNENSDYRALIDWVVKHQVKSKYIGKHTVEKAYEKLLKEIYQKKVNTN